MKVKIHKLFEYLLETTAAEPEAILGYSLSNSPRLGDFLDDLDPHLSLDWNNRDFLGLPELREHVLAQSGLSHICQLADVLITAGTAEANFLAIMQLVQPGDEMIAESPGWPQPFVLGEAIGATVKIVHRREEKRWELDLDQLEALITAKTRLIFLTNPNNPTGKRLTTAELKRVIALADRVGAFLLVDEVYAGLEWQGERAPSVAGLYKRGITTNSVSKVLGLQGLRTGWLICRQEEVIRDAYILRENSSEIMNIMGEAIAEIALRPERYAAAVTQAQNEGRKNLTLLDDFITSRSELSWEKPEAGLIGLARLHADFDGETVARNLLKSPYRTFLLPGSAYRQPHYIRLGVGGGQAVNLPLGLSRLAQFFDDLK